MEHEMTTGMICGDLGIKTLFASSIGDMWPLIAGTLDRIEGSRKV